MIPCPGRLALCGVPCGCNGENPSHRSVTVPPPRVPPDEHRCHCPTCREAELRARAEAKP